MHIFPRNHRKWFINRHRLIVFQGPNGGYQKLFFVVVWGFQELPEEKNTVQGEALPVNTLGEITQWPIYFRPFIEVITPFLWVSRHAYYYQ